MAQVRYGIEHEVAFRRADGAFADFTNTTFEELQGIVDALPEDPADYPDLRIGDQGIKRKRWYVEGFERFDEAGGLVRCDPKGIEIRTRIHDSVEEAVAALAADLQALEDEAAGRGLEPYPIGFNPVRSSYPVVPELNAWERAHRTGSPEERTAHLHMVTHGPDLNLSVAGLGGAELVDAGAKLTHYSPWLVPLAFSSPFRDGAPWGGLSARTAVRTGLRPAAMVFLEPGSPHALATDPSLTQPARLPAEVGRIEFKAFDACPDPVLYGELLSLLTGLVLDDTLPGRRRTPDAGLHRHVAVEGLADPETHAGTGALLDAAERALADRPADLTRLVALRERWRARECPATAMLARLPIGTGIRAF
ncbi:glutamate-cysteine ligase family protein [Pseudonocardia sp. NPDC049154]|uniref:glutamate-cysteine ligase family protein n=1 Tax=Pseudonocardia sp. NPDC049154 TaxID=3155501 RepID=UPI0033D44918